MPRRVSFEPRKDFDDHQDSSRAILEHVGGAANVAALHHCSTRLRFTLADESRADEAALKATPGVIGVVTGTQTQVIVGSGVADYFREIEKLRSGGTGTGRVRGSRPRSRNRRSSAPGR